MHEILKESKEFTDNQKECTEYPKELTDNQIESKEFTEYPKESKDSRIKFTEYPKESKRIHEIPKNQICIKTAPSPDIYFFFRFSVFFGNLSRFFEVSYHSYKLY